MDPAQCMAAIDDVRALATFVVFVVTVGGIVAMGNLLQESKPKKEPSLGVERNCPIHRGDPENCREKHGKDQ